jgi:hypothetical protein
MTDETIIDATGIFEAVSKAGTSKPKGKPRKALGINYKPSTREKREALTRVLPVIKGQRADRIRANRRQGQKSSYNRGLLDDIFNLMAEGLTCQDAQQAVGLPASTFANWLEKGGGDAAEALSAREAYARARANLADAAFSQALAIPRQLYAMAIGQGQVEGEAEGPPVDSAMVQAGKLLTDSLRWYAERLAPNSYADRKADAPVVNVTNNSLTISGRDLSSDQRQQLRQLLTAAAQPPVIEG